MSLQVFLQAQLLGSERFLVSSVSNQDAFAELMGRCGWLGLIAEILPRALLAEMKLSRMLLGSSGGEQFLLVLTDESIRAAEDFLTKAASEIETLSGGALALVWTSTENLGPWPIVRKRLDDGIGRLVAAPLAGQSPTSVFEPFSAVATSADAEYFADFGERLMNATRVGWSADQPAHLHCDTGTYQWSLRDQAANDEDSITFPRRYALNDEQQYASLHELAGRAEGSHRWGILRGDVDYFDLRLKRSDTIEEHIHLSVLFKEFFSGELSVLCTLPEFWRKVSIVYKGGDDFVVIGAWDALVLLARELQRLFERFSAQNLQGLAGLEGKSISMALALASSCHESPVAVFEEAGHLLQTAKSTELGTFHLFGRTLEW
jgi:CRISPR-associated protein Csm1